MQMGADVQALDSTAVTEEVLQQVKACFFPFRLVHCPRVVHHSNVGRSLQTGIGKTVRIWAKPLKPLQQLSNVEKKAT